MKESLKEKLNFLATILDTVPESVYEGKVYTLLVLIEFESGQKAYVFGGPIGCPPMLGIQDMIGKTRSVILTMLASTPKRVQTPEKGVYAQPTKYMDILGPILDLTGCIEEIIVPDDPKMAERWRDVILDFGAGKILFDINKKDFHLNLKKGDYVHVSGRVDLADIL